MDKFTNIHTITLVAEQAKWWKETCIELGIDARFSNDPDAFCGYRLFLCKISTRGYYY